MRTGICTVTGRFLGDPQPLPSIVMPEDGQDEADLATPRKQGVDLTALC